jgi:acyl dehydratase
MLVASDMTGEERMSEALAFGPLEDLRKIRVGSRWRSAGRTLTEAELSWACMLTADWHPIHADAGYAASSAVGQRTFHGGFGILLALGAAAQYPDVGVRNALALGIEDWKFAAPLFIGDTVHVEIEITGLRRTSDGTRTVVQRRVRLVKGEGEVAHEGTANLLVYLSADLGDFDDTAHS